MRESVDAGPVTLWIDYWRLMIDDWGGRKSFSTKHLSACIGVHRRLDSWPVPHNLAADPCSSAAPGWGRCGPVRSDAVRRHLIHTNGNVHSRSDAVTQRGEGRKIGIGDSGRVGSVHHFPNRRGCQGRGGRRDTGVTADERRWTQILSSIEGPSANSLVPLRTWNFKLHTLRQTRRGLRESVEA
jgi:hypothetical protein